jgi:hypothetical protein
MPDIPVVLTISSRLNTAGTYRQGSDDPPAGGGPEHEGNLVLLMGP